MCSRRMHLLRYKGENWDYVRSLFQEKRRKMHCVLGDLFRQAHGRRINLGSVWPIKGKTLLRSGSWRACREFVLWQKNHLIGPRRRQQPNFFNAFPFTHFVWITAYHPGLLCNQRNKWRQLGEKFGSCLSLLWKLLNPLTSLKCGVI